MKGLATYILVTALLVGIPTAHADHMVYPETQEAIEAEFLGMPWEYESSSYALAKSGSSLQLPEGLGLVRGEAAERFVFLNEGVEYPDIEAVVVDFESFAMVFFGYTESGYVTLDDWADLDADDMLDEIIKNTKEGNIERKKYGLPDMQITGWASRPRLDHPSNSVVWAINGTTDEGDILNAVSIRLGRKGFEKLVWAGEPSQFGTDNLLDAMLEGHAFDQGLRYADYSVGDKLAGFGIAALVAVTAGANTKTGKGFLAGLLAVVLVFLKKGWILILLFLGGAGAFLKRVVGRRKSTPQQKDMPLTIPAESDALSKEEVNKEVEAMDEMLYGDDDDKIDDVKR